MRLLLIRHGETVDNVGGKYAGHTDSALTAHGVLQARRLGIYLAGGDNGRTVESHYGSTRSVKRDVDGEKREDAAVTGRDGKRHRVTQIFASDLRRAVDTAGAVRDAQLSVCEQLEEMKEVAAQDGVPAIQGDKQASSPTASEDPPPLHVTKLQLLREKDFGSWEGRRYAERPKDREKRDCDAYRSLTGSTKESNFKPEETKDSMRKRCETFMDEYLSHSILSAKTNHTIVIVAHGIILLHLWRCILGRFDAAYTKLHPEAGVAGDRFGLEYLGTWSNTGVWDLEIKPRETSTPSSKTLQSELYADSASVPDEVDKNDSIPPEKQITTITTANSKHQSINTTTTPPPKSTTFTNMTLLIRAVNSTAHLIGLKKTGGGLGNVKHDASQKTMESFFGKKRKLG